MHRIDRLELLDTLAEVRREAGLLLNASTHVERLASLRRISFLLAYMGEHLEMLSAPACARCVHEAVAEKEPG
jgi:hypothetical protein